MRRPGLPGLRSMYGPLIKGGVRMHWNHATFSGRERGVQPPEGDHKRSATGGCTRYLIHHQVGMVQARTPGGLACYLRRGWDETALLAHSFLVVAAAVAISH